MTLEKEGLATFYGQIGYIGSPGYRLENHDFKGELTGAGLDEAKAIKRRKWLDHNLERQTTISEKTGESVIASNRIQRQSTLWSLLLAAISTIFIVITVILSYRDETPKKLQEIERALRTQGATLKSIQTSLEKTGSCWQSLMKDSFELKKK